MIFIHVKDFDSKIPIYTKMTNADRPGGANTIVASIVGNSRTNQRPTNIKYLSLISPDQTNWELLLRQEIAGK